jgi:hypothetical protein
MRLLPFIGASVVCCVAGAHASVVTFSNTGNVFNWRPYAVQQPPGLQLDITLPATQSGGATPYSISWSRGSPGGSDIGVTHDMGGSASARVVRSTVGVEAQLYSGGGPYYVYPPLDFLPGTTIGPGLNWQNTATLGWLRFDLGEHWVVGSAFTMGLQLTMPDGVHYGYGNFVLSSGTYGTQYQPTSWGYETDPGVPVTVPGPGGLSVIWLGATAAFRRKRVIPVG